MIHVNFNAMACLDSASLAKCFNAYADYCSGEVIESIGFNPNSGYAYIALENGVCIASAFNRDVEYIISNPYGGEWQPLLVQTQELFFDDYEQALNYQPSQVN